MREGVMIKEILVHLDGSADDESRIIHADHLAGMHQAHIRGLYLNLLPEPPVGISHYAISRSLMSQRLDETRTQCRSVEHALERRFAKLSASHDLRRFDCIAANVGDVVMAQAQTADLMVVRTPYRIDKPNRASTVVEAALFGSGRGVFVIPEEDPLRLRPMDTILVAWKNSREAANAVAQAMPFLRQAKEVVIATVATDGPEEVPGDRDLASYLERHDVAAEIRRLGKWDTVAAGLFNEAELLNAGLIVAGAYSHSRPREWALGGVTRDILTKTPIPALLAH
ncbi:universal stress protein family protein [Nitrospirillum viridazoti Y2]|nr:universal stress protein family protein [Nitrospirillum amazonense Y2]